MSKLNNFMSMLSSSLVHGLLALLLAGGFVYLGVALVYGYEGFVKSGPTIPSDIESAKVKQHGDSMKERFQQWGVLCDAWLQNSNTHPAVTSAVQPPVSLKQQAQCLGLAQDYAEHFSLLIAQHEALIRKKEEIQGLNEKRESSVNAVMAILGLCVAFITLGVGWGALGMERLKKEWTDERKSAGLEIEGQLQTTKSQLNDATLLRQKAQEALDALLVQTKMQQVKAEAQHELYSYISLAHGLRAANRNLANHMLHMDLLQSSNDEDSLKKAYEVFNEIWCPAFLKDFPKGKEYVELCKEWHQRKGSMHLGIERYFKFFH
jgi:hypothetical protein